MVSVALVRAQLSDLVQWLPLLGDVNAALLGLHGASFSLSGVGGVRDGLAFGLDRVLDRPEDGGAGVRTEAGALDLLRSWAVSFAQDRGEAVPAGVLAYLLALVEWAHEHADWEAFAETVGSTHTVVARATGHAPVAWGTCAHCLGQVVTDPGREGIPEWGECEVCGTWYRDGEDLVRARVEELRSPHLPERLFVTYAQLRGIWPELSKDQVKKWCSRRRALPVVAGPPRRYQLRAVNQLMAVRTGLAGLARG